VTGFSEGQAYGMSQGSLRREPFRFNLLVNDDDLGKREGWVELAPHLGKNKDAHKFPSMRFE